MPLSLLVPAVLIVGTLTFFCWRIGVGAMAARPISDRLRQAAGLAGPAAPMEPDTADFGLLDSLATAAGALDGASRGTGLVRAYYRAVRAVGGLLPALGPWSEREMFVCSRYLAVRVDRRLASNSACSHRVRSL